MPAPGKGSRRCPQPIPNSTPPAIKRPSMMVLDGISMRSPDHEVVRCFAIAKAGTPMAIAPPMTNARLGSHGPTRSRKEALDLGGIGHAAGDQAQAEDEAAHQCNQDSAHEGLSEQVTKARTPWRSQRP